MNDTHDIPTGCTGSCSSCSGCSARANARLDLGEMVLMYELMQTPFLPVCRIIAVRGGERKEALSPVYFNDPKTTLSEIEEIGRALTGMAERGLITIDYDIPLQSCDYNEYKTSDILQNFIEIMGEKAEGVEKVELDMGSMALTNFGRAVIENLSMGQ